MPTKTLKLAFLALSMAARSALWSTPSAAAWTLSLRQGVTEGYDEPCPHPAIIAITS